ncbi:hypothetical protein D3C78_1556650 [compost metagenome]
MQEGRRCPYTRQGAGFVGSLFAHPDGQAKTVHGRTFLGRDSGLAISAALNESGDVGQAFGDRELAQVQRFLGRGLQLDIEVGQFRRVPLQ